MRIPSEEGKNSFPPRCDELPAARGNAIVNVAEDCFLASDERELLLLLLLLLFEEGGRKKSGRKKAVKKEESPFRPLFTFVAAKERKRQVVLLLQGVY